MNGLGSAAAFSDPTGLYSTFIPERWIFQAHQSTSSLTVFYGEGDWDILYFELLGQVPDTSAQALAERSLKLYQEPGGLEQFHLERDLKALDVRGQQGVSSLYTYQNTHGNTLWEERIFLVLPDGRGFSITLGGDGSEPIEEPPILKDAIARWRWSLPKRADHVLLNSTPVNTAISSSGGRFERTLGTGAVPEIIKQYGGEYIVPLQEKLWLEEVFRRLVSVTERQDVEYSLLVLGSNEPNAFSLPGGYIFITQGLLKLIGSDASKLAAVLGHEIAHVEKKHGVNAVLRQMGLTVLLEVGVMVLDMASADLFRIATGTLLQLLQLGWGREAEYEADLVGQSIAVRAGFDGLGAVTLLDDLATIENVDLPMKVFRTHPDTKDRRKRMEENLLLFWPTPTLVTAGKQVERLDMGRDYEQNRRIDPNNRYLIRTDLLSSHKGLEVYDSQLNQTIRWLDEVSIRDFTWSPNGQYLAVLVETVHSGREVWLCDRFGYILKKWVPEHAGQIQTMHWSPEGTMLALELNGEKEDILVTYVATDVFLAVAGERGGKNALWLGSELYFLQNGQWHVTEAPQVWPVVVPNPVPRVIQRKRILSPAVVKEGNTIRLTRPSLSIP